MRKAKAKKFLHEGLYVEFLLKIEDVTKEIEEAAKDATGADRIAKVNAAVAAVKQTIF